MDNIWIAERCNEADVDEADGTLKKHYAVKGYNCACINIVNACIPHGDL